MWCATDTGRDAGRAYRVMYRNFWLCLIPGVLCLETSALRIVIDGNCLRRLGGRCFVAEDSIEKEAFNLVTRRTRTAWSISCQF